MVDFYVSLSQFFFATWIHINVSWSGFGSSQMIRIQLIKIWIRNTSKSSYYQFKSACFFCLFFTKKREPSHGTCRVRVLLWLIQILEWVCGTNKRPVSNLAFGAQYILFCDSKLLTLRTLALNGYMSSCALFNLNLYINWCLWSQ